MGLLKMSILPFISLYYFLLHITRTFVRTISDYTNYLRPLCRVLFKWYGWRAVGEVPPQISQFVMIAAPHTSNWDFPVMIAASSILHFRLKWLGKKSLFQGPLGPLMKALGGIPVDRSASNNTVDQAAASFHGSERLILGIAPEGTRRKAQSWKSGFYHIALKAKVPVVCGFIDYRTKTAGLGPVVFLTGDKEIDMGKIRDFYKDKQGKFPENQGQITF